MEKIWWLMPQVYCQASYDIRHTQQHNLHESTEVVDNMDGEVPDDDIDAALDYLTNKNK